MEEGKSEKSRKSVKVKNPCKMCTTTVNQKTGIQCKGACKKWMHYACLKYTPGKIQDIKDGFIKIICPCPDCEGLGPKEKIISKPLYKCAKSCCPKKEVPTCASSECPVNIHLAAKQNGGETQCEVPPTCALLKGIAPQAQTPLYPPQFGAPPMPLNNLQLPGQQNRETCPTSACQSTPTWQPNAAHQLSRGQFVTQPYTQAEPMPQQPYQPISEVQQPCPSCPMTRNQAMPQQPGLQGICSPPQQTAAQTSPITSKKGSNNRKSCCNKQDQPNGPPSANAAKQSKSCSCMSNHSRRKDKCIDNDNLKDKGQSATNLKDGSLYANLDEMCKTVGLLTAQIRELMCKLVKHTEDKTKV